MSRRKAALQDLELLRNTDDVQSEVSDDNDNDYEDNDFKEEMETLNTEYDSDEDSYNVEPEEKTSIDKTTKNGTIWVRLNDEEEASLRKKINFNEKAGPTSYATRQINETKLSAFFMIFDLSMINLILNCTNCHSKAVDPKLSFTKEDILAFIGVLYARGVLCPNIPLKDMWSRIYGVSMIQKFMARDKFLLILKYIRFDDKSTRSERVKTDKFSMARQIWDKFIENAQACYRPGLHLTVDELLLPSKNRCSFIQYMPNKTEKFGIKSWILSDAETKYILNGFPYLGKEIERPNDKLQGEFVVEKLIEPYNNKGYCVTADNFFSSYTLVENLLKKKTTFIGTVRKKTKIGVNCVDNMTRLYSVKTKTRRWPVAVFFNILNLVGINSWILYKTCNSTKISRRMYLRSLADELLEMVSTSVQPTTSVASKKRLTSTEPDLSPKSAKKKCQIRLCNGNKSSFTCDKCKKFTCGPCVGEKVLKSTCKNCYEQGIRI